MWLSLVNHLGKKGSSLIEIMAMITVLWLAIASMFSTVIWGIYFAKDSENRIKAINLAREWIEWTISLRNTNWLRFSSDQINCWRFLDYDNTCIGNTTPIGTDVIGGIVIGTPVSYVIENKNGAWYLTGTITGSWLWVNTDGYYVASGVTAWEALCTISKTTDCRSPFSRLIKITLTAADTITVTSVVDWFEHRAQKVVLTTTLTNWKSKF